jgi:polysaccharide biosynthesis protein PslH
MDLLCFHEGIVDGEAAEIFQHVWTVPLPTSMQSNRWHGMLTDWNPRGLYPHSIAVEELLSAEINPDDYDVIWDAGASMFLHLPASWDAVPVVADLVDDMVLTFWRAMRSTPGLISKLRILKYLSVKLLFERYCMRRTAHCVVVSEDDAATFHMVSPRVPVSVIQNGVDLDYYSPGDCGTISGRLVFEGTMAFPPNQQAAVFLVKEIMPIIWVKRPDASLTLVGRDPPSEIIALANDRVFVTGAVDDIRPYVREAEVFVCPLQSGAGIKNKLLQAWAMGKAVVATNLSVGGLGAKDRQNLMIRDTPEAIASGVLELLENNELRNLLEQSGRGNVEDIFSWSRQENIFERLLLASAE